MVNAAEMSLPRTVLQVSGAFKAYHYGKYPIPALNGVSFGVAPGEFVALFGQNGAGKSTLLRSIVGLQPLDSGEISIEGLPVGDPRRRFKPRVGFVGQERSLMSAVTVREELEFQGRAYGLSRRESQQAATKCARLLGIEDLLGRDAIQLSGGQRRRVEIAFALVHSPSLLVLDEPTVGLDPGTREALWSLLESIQRDLGTTVLMSTHYLDEAASLLSRVIIMDYGRILADDAPQEVLRNHASNSCKLVLSSPIAADASSAVGRLIAIAGAVENEVVDVVGTGIIIRDPDPEVVAARIADQLGELKLELARIEIQRGTMQDAFFSITGRKLPLD